MHWGHLIVDKKGYIETLPIALEPRPEEGYFHNFSGSIFQGKVSHPTDRDREVTPAFFTAPGTGENGYVSFLEAPPTVMAISSDPTLTIWEPERYRVTDKDTYKGKYDRINKEWIENRYEMRDPIVFERDGRVFMIVAGTAVPGRVGQGIIAILEPSDPDDFSKPWSYIGDMFRHPRATIAAGGPGIIETPNLQRVGDKDILFFSAQRKPHQAPLKGFNHHEGIEYFVGNFDSSTGKFTPDKDGENGFFEYGRSFYAINATHQPDTDNATFVGWIKGHASRSDWNDVEERGWKGVITFPRTMKLVDGKVFTEPDRRLQKLRSQTWMENQNISLKHSSEITPIKDRTLNIEATVNLESATSAAIYVLADENGRAGIPIIFNGRTVRVLDESIPLSASNSVDLEIIVDRSVVTVFAEGKSLTKIVTPPKKGETYTDRVVLGV
jgi:sucrose-6-phosphate hydrolase SacC (GH32 family)